MTSEKSSSKTDEGSPEGEMSEECAAVLSLIDHFVWKADPSGKMLEDSPRWRDFTGQEWKDWKDEGWQSAVHRRDLPRIAAAFETGKKSEENLHLTFRLKHWSGDWGDVEMRAKPLRDSPSGDFVKWIGILQRVSTKEKLRRSEETLETVLEALPVGVIIADANGQILKYNRANRELWGLPPKTTAWEQHADWVGYHPDTGKRVQVEEWAMTRAVQTGETIRGQFVEVERFGTKERRFVLNNGAPIFDRHGKVTGGVVAQLDITERIEAERELQKQQAWFQNLADNISQLVWMADADGEIFWYNKRWFEYTGTTLEDVQGWGWTQVHHPDHLDRVMKRWKRSHETGEVWEDTFPLKGKDGVYRWFLSRAQPVLDEEGKVIRWFGTNTDITQQRMSEEALREADRRKDEFLATLAHELRNPLAPIRTGLEVIKMADGNAELIERVRGTMENQTLHLVRLIEDLLDVSRITRGKLELRKTQFDLDEVIQTAAATVSPAVETHQHNLELEVPQEPLLVEADASRLSQMLSNLLVNAARYTPDGGNIKLSASAEGENVMISVRDDGRGIAPENQEKIFEMFTQGGIDSDLSGGLGIGLTLVRTLAEMHDGEVWLESEGEGRGSEFFLKLPILVHSDESRETEEPENVPTESGEKLRVLVVDDNVAAAENLAALVRLHRHDVEIVHDGESAMRKARELDPDLALMDLGMPEMSGFELARLIRKEPWGENLTLVAVSGWGQEEARRRSKEAGFDKHLIKGDEPVALAKILSDVAQDSEISDDNEEA